MNPPVILRRVARTKFDDAACDGFRSRIPRRWVPTQPARMAILPTSRAFLERVPIGIAPAVDVRLSAFSGDFSGQTARTPIFSYGLARGLFLLFF